MRQQDGDEIVAIVPGVLRVERDRDHVAVVFHGNGNAEGVLERVAERNVDLAGDRRPQQRARAGIGDALKGHRDPRHAQVAIGGFVDQRADHGAHTGDNLGARHGQRVEADLLADDDVAGIVDQRRRQRVQRQDDADHRRRVGIEPKRDLGTAPPCRRRIAVAKLAQDAVR